MTKRHLTPEEIEEILAPFREYQSNVFTDEFHENVFQNITSPIRKELEKIQVYPSVIDDLKEKIYFAYRPVEAGKAVGICTAQSIGEVNTQMTLNTFHTAGLAKNQMVAGVPRLLEILFTNKTNSQSYHSCFIKILKGYNASEVIKRLIYQSFGTLSTLIRVTKEEFEWESKFIEFFRCKTLETCVRIHLKFDIEKLFRSEITLDDLAKIVAANFKKVLNVYYSPMFIGEMVILFSSKSEASDAIKELQDIKVKGIEGIENAFAVNEIIQTEGTNLAKVLLTEGVDGVETYSNNFWEMLEIWGIEAVREMLRAEMIAIIANVSPAHIDIILDRMTMSGKLKSMTRHTRKNEISSVISKSTFEETLLIFKRAAIFEEEDNIQGSSAAIMCADVVQMGSGIVSLIPID